MFNKKGKAEPTVVNNYEQGLDEVDLIFLAAATILAGNKSDVVGSAEVRVAIAKAKRLYAICNEENN